MSLADTFANIAPSVFHIVFLDQRDQRIGSGTGFISCGFLITNHHVFRIADKAHRVWVRRQEDEDLAKGSVFTKDQFTRALRSGSEEKDFDFAVLELPDVAARKGVRNLILREKRGLRVGDRAALAGYPLEHLNLTCHAGIISSFFSSGRTYVIQLDASVNPSNSGGPLFDIDTCEVLGIVTRRATGLTKAFAELRTAAEGNIAVLEKAKGAAIMGLDFASALQTGQRQMLTTLGEIERQANVGIGYAFAADHLLGDNVIHRALHPE